MDIGLRPYIHQIWFLRLFYLNTSLFIEEPDKVQTIVLLVLYSSTQLLNPSHFFEIGQADWRDKHRWFTHKLCSYVDDPLLYIWDPDESKLMDVQQNVIGWVMSWTKRQKSA